ncbi:unnamed protein product [Dibothriocephalus latus]|uniref:Uncharacterized protein n=1 Tax=Dibothriocephalus latus TaxID=60516 RepID=A0A3P7LG92_DIBLA|nr:unnamed protein product [Dibothriocephalus latus]
MSQNTDGMELQFGIASPNLCREVGHPILFFLEITWRGTLYRGCEAIQGFLIVKDYLLNTSPPPTLTGGLYALSPLPLGSPDLSGPVAGLES